jgi:hypothetical protein
VVSLGRARFAVRKSRGRCRNRKFGLDGDVRREMGIERREREVDRRNEEGSEEREAGIVE